MPETLMELDGILFSGYKPKNNQEFTQDPAIDKFIEYCLSGENFYFEEFYE